MDKHNKKTYNLQEFAPLRNFQQLVCIILFVLISILLYYRDVMGGTVNKYIFCVAIIPYIFIADIDNALILWGFIMPLQVGLPGNILLPCFLFRMIIQKIHAHKVIYVKEFCCTVFLMCFMFFQNIIYGFLSIYNMMCIIELLLVYMVMFRDDKSIIPLVIIGYSLGVALTGTIMLLATLKKVGIINLLNTATRLGDYQYSEGMSINIDPNFYGLFAITVLSANWLLVHANIYTRIQNILAYISVFISLAISLIGLSRGFIIGLALWAVMTICLEKRIDRKARALLFVISTVIVAFLFFPEVINAALNRFMDADAFTGNGRVGLMQIYGDEWKQSFHSILFGIGLFVSEAHCMQAQFLFGIGLVGTIPLFMLGFWYWRYSHLGEKIQGNTLVPIIIVQVVAGLLPTARSLTNMMPVVVSLLVLQAYNNKVISDRLSEQGANNNEAEKSSYIKRDTKHTVINNDRFRYIL